MKPTAVRTPTDKDVLLGRGGGTNHHPGNIRFRKFVSQRKVAYLQCLDKQKQELALGMVQELRTQGVRFLRKDKGGLWVDVGDKKAREKTSQALRENAPQIKRELDNAEEQVIKTAPKIPEHTPPRRGRGRPPKRLKVTMTATSVVAPREVSPVPSSWTTSAPRKSAKSTPSFFSGSSVSSFEEDASERSRSDSLYSRSTSPAAISRNDSLDDDTDDDSLYTPPHYIRQDTSVEAPLKTEEEEEEEEEEILALQPLPELPSEVPLVVPPLAHGLDETVADEDHDAELATLADNHLRRRSSLFLTVDDLLLLPGM